MRNGRPSRAAALLRALLEQQVFSVADLARELVVSPAAIARFAAGSVSIPLDRQLYLAVLVVQSAPSHARHGYQLWGQAMAAMAYEQHVTETHRDPPLDRFWRS